ncbi:methyltransferase domain-containing protein [Porifericola rhodea]|uniref:class I SAM-dependent methyltransferase n=1 Tax=Porifericola rhodea TaxID=930972 RepID=UPI002666327D|nr:methyltransferase domain-containing protein [Porifericola rhodea]WKN31466.1 methyltransferase domain-containing protein [Porifericola rhodea]
MEWFRKDALTIKHQTQSTEQWIRESNGELQSFKIDTYLGKKTDLLSLKKNIVGNLKKTLEYFQKTRTEVYAEAGAEMVKECPVCGSSSDKAVSQLNVYGANYAQCKACTHIYVLNRPNPNAIHNFYLSDVNYASTYTDKSAAESRLQAIAVPWRDWMVKVFEKQYGRKPEKILDVGSGAGHFVEACRRSGLQADGIELSESSRKFSKDIWGIELDGNDYTQVYNQYSGYDVVTFWGLLEHTPNPKELLNVSQSIFESSDAGMVIAKLPRWNSLSGFIQNILNQSIVRHLDPMGHISCYTDGSAAEAYYQTDFYPVAAWYYGMDVYELFMQLGHKLDQYEVLTQTSDVQLSLQQMMDEAKLSDGLTLVGVPKNKHKA